MRVIVDLVLNHCSSEHPWFTEGLVPKDSPYHDWFVWRDEKPDWEHNLHMWHDHARDATGEYYYGFFWHGMPDLNYDNPFVSATAYDISRTWLEDLGAHGFRLDAIRHLIERDGEVASTPETIEWLEAYHRYLRSVDDECFSVGEIWGPTSEVMQYIPNALDSAFEFQLASTIIESVNSGDGAGLAEHINRLNESYGQSGGDAAPYSTFLTNHDQNRLMSELGGVGPEGFEKNKLAASILLTLPGTPFLYYGEEIGMTGTKPDPDLRVPMQWTADTATAGFTTGEPWRAPNADTATVNVASQKPARNSLWRHYQRMIELRLGEPALRRGRSRSSRAANDNLLAYRRRLGDDDLLVLANLGDRALRGFSVALGGFEAGERVRGRVLAGDGRARGPGRPASRPRGSPSRAWAGGRSWCCGSGSDRAQPASRTRSSSSAAAWA
jgi:alpha-amylase